MICKIGYELKTTVKPWFFCVHYFVLHHFRTKHCLVAPTGIEPVSKV